VLLYPLLYFAGLWIPRQNMAATMRHIGDLTPSAPQCNRYSARCKEPFRPLTHSWPWPSGH
jgi:hypothetical protein